MGKLFNSKKGRKARDTLQRKKVEKRIRKGKFEGSEQHTGIDPYKRSGTQPTPTQGPPSRSNLGGLRSPLSVR